MIVTGPMKRAAAGVVSPLRAFLHAESVSQNPYVEGFSPPCRNNLNSGWEPFDDSKINNGARRSREPSDRRLPAVTTAPGAATVMSWPISRCLTG